MALFQANALPLFIGSLPHEDCLQALDLVFSHTPAIPLWPQLPSAQEEGMLRQFLSGMPGAIEQNGKVFIDTRDKKFESEFLAFFEEYLEVSEGAKALEDSRFLLLEKEARCLHPFLERIVQKKQNDSLVAVKGQITGPITFCTGVADQDGRAIFYNETLRDAAVKLLALKARWQTRQLAKIKPGPLLFIDEPALAGFGSSAFITIVPEDIVHCFHEIYSGVREEGGLVGVHVCANTEWSIIFDSGVDIVSYDAYSYFEKLIIYPRQLQDFFARGGILASGIVPSTSEALSRETRDSLVDKWFSQLAELERLGIERRTVFEQTLITPSCGLGTLSVAEAVKVAELTREVSLQIRSKFS